MSRRSRALTLGRVRSIQSGTVTIAALGTAGTATLGTAVSLANSLLVYNGRTLTVNNEPDQGRYSPRLELTDSTTVTATVGVALGATTITVAYTVIEFFPGVVRSVQRGTIAFSAGTSSTGTLGTAVNPAKAIVMSLQNSSNQSADRHDRHWVRLSLTDSTTVTAEVNSTLTASGVTVTAAYQVVEFV